MNIDGKKAADQFAFSDAFNNTTEGSALPPVGPRDPRIATRVVQPFSMNEKLMALRANNPFVQILPIPNYVNSIVLATAGDKKSLPIPSGAKYMILNTNATCAMTRNGNPDTGFVTDAIEGNGPFVLNLQTAMNMLWYVEGMQSLSFYAYTNATLVTAGFLFD